MDERLVGKTIDCRGCGQPVLARSPRCWACGRSVADAFAPERTGLGTLSQALVILSVFAVVLLGIVVLAERQGAVENFAAASARAVAIAELDQAEADRRAAAAAARASRSEPPAPAPDAGGPGTYTVQEGDSLFSAAQDLGLDPNELIFWNKATYPTLQSTPALKPGWVLQTTGPPLPTRAPQPSQQPTPKPQVANPGPGGAAGPGSALPALPTFDASAFPASQAVTVSYYAVSGGSPYQIYESMQGNGPWSDWLGRNAQAHVRSSPSFNLVFRTDAYGGCVVVPTALTAVTVTYAVLLPSWSPPAGVSTATVNWWIDEIHQTVAHEAHHISIYESYLPAMNEAVMTGTCSSVEADLIRITTEVRRANCEFDLVEYGYSLGETIESCMASG